MSSRWYVLLDGINPEPCSESDSDPLGMFSPSSCRVMRTEIIDGVNVSTVFLGLDHSFGGDEPILWETMVFVDQVKAPASMVRFQHEMTRCSGNRYDALDMHARMIDMLTIELAMADPEPR